MPKLTLNLFGYYRKIFCACNCGEVFRLSDAPPSEKSTRPPMDWLEKLNQEQDRIESKLDREEDRQHNERGKLVAKQRSLAEKLCNSRIEEVLPGLRKLKINSRDVRHLGAPVTLVSFDGLADRSVRAIRFLNGVPASVEQEKLYLSVESVVKAGNIDWSTTRIQDDGRAVRVLSK